MAETRTTTTFPYRTKRMAVSVHNTIKGHLKPGHILSDVVQLDARHWGFTITVQEDITDAHHRHGHHPG